MFKPMPARTQMFCGRRLRRPSSRAQELPVTLRQVDILECEGVSESMARSQLLMNVIQAISLCLQPFAEGTHECIDALEISR